LVLQELVGDRLQDEYITELATLHDLRWRLGRYDGVVVRAGDPRSLSRAFKTKAKLDMNLPRASP